MKFTGVGFVLSVAHNSPEGVLHGHSYEVTVWYRFGSDARALQRHTDYIREKYDHSLVDDALRFGEDLAEQIGRDLPGCIRVDVDRPLERIFTRWEKE